MITEGDGFAHGFHYGDNAGVIFFGPPTNGFWLDRLAISGIYIGPLFRGILDRTWRESGGEKVPKLASDWNTLQGWKADGGPVSLAPADASEFAGALAQVGHADVAQHCAGCTVEECLRCATAIREFICSRLARGVNLFVEDD